MKTMFFFSAKATSSGRRSPPFLTGRDSPVREASMTSRAVSSSILPSAGTLSPASR